jgi:DNA repair protein RecO (recombination protein O)
VRAHSNRRSFQTEALLLGRVEYGEADLIVQFFTRTHGRLSAIARGARRNQKRYSGALEPFHTLSIELTEAVQGDLHSLKSSSIEVARDRLSRSLVPLTEAGRALGWLKLAAPTSVAEPELWEAISTLLDELAALRTTTVPPHLTAAFALRLLELLGWGINLHSCVSCGKACPTDRPSWISPERGGLICSACGGGPIKLGPVSRARLLRATQDNETTLDDESAAAALRIAERALRSHTGMDSRKAR